MSSWESRVFAVVDEDKNCLCYLFDNWTDEDDNEVAETFKQYVEKFGTDRASLCTAMMYTGAKLYEYALWDAWDWEWEHGDWKKYEPSEEGYYNYKKIRKESKDFILRHPSIPDYLKGNSNEMISAFVGTGNVAMDHYRNRSAFITIKTLEEILNGSSKGAKRIAKKEPKEKPAKISGDSWKRVCSECGKKMASGYVVGGGDEYYCSDKCLHKHYSEKQWNRMYKQNDEDNYWTEWGPGDELDESLNESSNIDERYYDEIAFDLVDRIFDSLSHTPEWEDVDHYYHNPNLIDNWEDYWTQTISKSIKSCVARGELDIESDDWKTIVNNVKNSPVSVQLSEARKELVKIFEKIEFGE